jgi:Asp-tRNA(Asn)/Glu-tRNA(Gln) amidotransferase A subunit family amidase
LRFRRSSLPATAQALVSGTVDVLEYVRETIDLVDESDVLVRAIVPEPIRRQRLEAEAEALRRRYPTPSDRPPLFGVPVAVKDLFRVDGFATRAGSFLPADVLAGPESSFVTRLKESGALMLGKTETDEFAYSEPPVTRNPRNLKHTPGGSSGGSAAVVALGLTPLAIGTQTLRSIVGPACFCGVVGYKPSWGSIPIDGVVMMAPSIDTVGFLTQDVESVVVAAKELADIDATPQARRPVLGMIDGLMRSSLEADAEVAYRSQMAGLESAGFEVRHVQLFDDEWLKAVTARSMTVLHYEMAEVHKDWFAEHGQLYRERTRQAVTGGQKISRDDYLPARAFIDEYRRRMTDLMDDNNIDLWALPGTRGSAPEGYQSTGSVDMTGTWSYGGLASIAIPAGTAPNGLPLGLQFIPRYGHDADLLGWARLLAVPLGQIAARG